MIDLREIERRVLEGEELEDILSEYEWKDFEHLVAYILERHEFQTFTNYRFKTDRKFEIDVIAVKENIVLVIECKMWSRGRYKLSALKQVAKVHLEKLNELKKFNPFFIQGKKVIPLVVTLFEEGIVEHEKVIFVPLWKLNTFLLNLWEFL